MPPPKVGHWLKILPVNEAILAVGDIAADSHHLERVISLYIFVLSVKDTTDVWRTNFDRLEPV